MQIKLEIFETTMSFVNSCTANFQIIYTYPRTGKVIETAVQLFTCAASPTPLVPFSLVDGFVQSRIRAAWHNVFLLA